MATPLKSHSHISYFKWEQHLAAINSPMGNYPGQTIEPFERPK
jgi:hypothetical protein